ncbi:helix-turn-helix transcriptional regulator [Pararoseomonas sp. SCSIO 73927]|uniref:helix-turn-helix domain-containing protein n=1 Tax=Pararoseomonas sp. SCSIO 73927 TaxID=3114537 RepID=UPI0030CAAF1D
MSDVGWSERLRARARELDLADAEVARRLGMSQGRYQNYVAGRREPDLATLLRICSVLQITPNDLLGIDGEVPAQDTTSRSIAASLAAMGSAKLGLAATLLRALASHDLHDTDGEARGGFNGGSRKTGTSPARPASMKKSRRPGTTA